MIYNYQGQGHFIDICPGCLRFSIFIFSSSKTPGLIEIKSHLEPLMDGGMKVWSGYLGHMIKMPIYGKNL